MPYDKLQLHKILQYYFSTRIIINYIIFIFRTLLVLLTNLYITVLQENLSTLVKLKTYVKFL